MPRVRASRLWLRFVAPLALAASVLASGCGGDSDGGGRLLSQEQAGDLLSTLTQVEQDVTDRDCTGAGEGVATLESQVDSIARLNRSLRRSLRASVRRLETLVSNACEATDTGTTTETTPTTPEPGPTGATGTTGDQGGEQPPPEEDQPQDKQPKEKKNGKVPPGQQDQGGGAGVPGESGSSGGGN